MCYKKDNPKRGNNKSSSGFTLVEVVVASALLIIGVTALFAAVLTSIKTQHTASSFYHATCLARNRIQRGLSLPFNTLPVLAESNSPVDQDGNSTTDGPFTVTTVKDGTSGNILITSTGVFDGETRTTRLELLGDKYSMWNALAANCAIIADGNITIETAAPDIQGRVHSNGSILHSTGNVKIQGDLTANGIIQIPPQPGFQAVPGHPKVQVPTYLPFDSWMDMAKNGGLYYNSSQNFAKVNLTPGNGVIYVNGDVTLGNRSSINGTLVASGSITINNRLTQTRFAPNWPALLAGLDVNLHNRNHFTGVIFAGNNITSRNCKTIDGQLIALNNIYVENGAELPTQGTPPIWDPDGVEDPEIIVGGWLQ